MKKLKNIIKTIFDIFEIYIPMILFFIVFIFYILIIAYRYIFFESMGDLFELDMIFFMWCAILAASYGGRSNKHIVFSIAYDKFSEKTKLICRIIGDVLIIVTFIILVPHAYESINFLKITRTSKLRIPFDVIYYPFLAFIVLTIIHYAVSLVKDIWNIIQRKKGNGESEDNDELKGTSVI